MSLISLSNVYRSFGSQMVLEGVSLTINRGEKIGLVGRNGVGKSTVLRLITGQERPEQGSVIRQPHIRVGQVEQDPRLDGALTVAQAVLQGRPDLVKMEQELRRLEARLGDEGADHDAILNDYGSLQHEYDRLGGHEFHGKASAILSGLGLTPETHDRLVAVLSGGQRTRLALAQLLLSDPDILLLDEPTNHLDLEATEWLQSYLQRSSATLLIVSHDRYLLDAVCDHIIEIENRQACSYKGDYSAFLRQKAERLEREKEVLERQQEQIQKLEAYIRRYKAGNRATMAKSREKMLARIDVPDRPRGAKDARLHLAAAQRSGRDVVRLEQVSKQFDDVPLFKDLNLRIERGDRVGLVGPNGAGKTTLIRMIIGQQPADLGAISIGTNVRLGYFSQDLRGISGSRSIIEEILADSELDIPAARSFLARFLFTDEEVFKSVDDLSGGERNRVALCKLFLARPNFLLLDEPTNHLDIATREGLINALEDFQGTLLVASHDRYLLDRIVNRVVEVADGAARVFEGNYSEYRRKRYGELQPAVIVPPARTPSGKPAGGGLARAGAAKPRAAATPTPPTKAAAGSPVKPPSVPRLERQIQEMEGRLASLTARMNDPDLYKSADMLTVVDEYDRVRLRLDRLYEEWSALAG